MGVSSRYKLRHRTKENRGNKNEHPQKRHKSKVTKNVLVKKTVTLAYLRGFRLFSGAKTKVHQSDRKRITSLSKSSKKIKPFHWRRLPLNLTILQDVSSVGFLLRSSP